ncbi:MAG: DUF411 domain-containing protein [Polaromonas sp.]
MQRRHLIRAIAGLAMAHALAPVLAQTKPRVEVWKDPNCGCCKDWISHLQANGFQTQVHDSGNVAARSRLGIPEKLGSCHTAQIVVKGRSYALEGHVPARDIRRLIKARPQAIGLAVPGMPVGSPGMDGPAYKDRKDAYDVLLVKADGSTAVYQSYPGA